MIDVSFKGKSIYSKSKRIGYNSRKFIVDETIVQTSINDQTINSQLPITSFASNNVDNSSTYTIIVEDAILVVNNNNTITEEYG